MSMKRKIITPIAVLFFFLCVWTIGAEDAAAPAPTGGYTKLALMDINYLFKKHAGFNEEMSRLKNDADAMDKEMKEQANSLRLQASLLQAMPAGSTEYAEAESKIAKAKYDWTFQVQTKRREFLMREAKCYYTTYQGIEGGIGEYARNHGISLGLRFVGDPVDPNNPESCKAMIERPVVWYNPKLDVTPRVLKIVSEKQKQTTEEEKLAEKENRAE